MNTIKEAPARQCAGLYHFQNFNTQKSTIAKRLTGSHCKCAMCDQQFNSVSAFDRHRVGGWEDHGSQRRCLTIPQMQAKGWQLNARGYWIERKRLDSSYTARLHVLPLTRRRA